MLKLLVLCLSMFRGFSQESVVGEVMFRYKASSRVAPPPRNVPPKRYSPPPKRSPPPPPLFNEEESELQIGCPEVLDVTSGYTIPSSTCNITHMTIASGGDADDLRATYGIMTGDIAQIEIDILAPLANNNHHHRILQSGDINIKSLRFTKRGEQKEIYTGTAIDLRTIVYIMDFSSCNPSWKAPVTPEALTNVLFQNKVVLNNLETYYRTCSYNKSTSLLENTFVVGPVKVPCQGFEAPPPRPPRPPRPPPRYPGYTFKSLSRRNETVDDWWDFSKFCTASEQQAWERAAFNFAVEYARNNSITKLDNLLKWRNRLRNLYILPQGLKCGWSGYADVTCTSASCSAYVKTSGIPNVHLMMHELMHNYGLEHAGRGTIEYGDQTDVMGDFNRVSSNSLLCHNAPNLYRIGWATTIPDGNLTTLNFTIGSNKLQSLYIPTMSQSDKNMILVNLGTDLVQSIPYSKYYISYRVRNTTLGAFDSGLPSQLSKQIHIHSYNGTQSERVFGFKPNFITSISQGKSWKSPVFVNPSSNMYGLGGALRIDVRSTTNDGVVIDLCRLTSLSESGDMCYDGIDNDCNGLIDSEEPNCQ